MSGMWKRSHGRTSEAPPDERGGYRYVRPTAPASHLDSTPSCRRRRIPDAPPTAGARSDRPRQASGAALNGLDPMMYEASFEPGDLVGPRVRIHFPPAGAQRRTSMPDP